MLKGLYSPLNKSFEKVDYILQEKVKLIYSIILFALILIPLIVVQVTFLDDIISYAVYIPLAVAFVAFFVDLLLLLNGKSSLSAHLTAILPLTSVWATMFLVEENSIIMRLDTIVIIVAILAILPIFVFSKIKYILLYFIINVAILFLFGYYLMQDSIISTEIIYEFCFDSFFAFAIVSFISTKVLKINNDAIDRADREIRINKHLNQRLKEKVVNQQTELTEAQDVMVDNEYKNDIAELTAGTLHNVNNVLTSVKISSEFVGQILSGNAIQGLKKANSLLASKMDHIKDFIANDTKGLKLLEYYIMLGEVLEEEVAESKKHLFRLDDKINSIADIITTQQNYSKITDSELLDLRLVINDALIMQNGSNQKFSINIIKDDTSDIPFIVANRSKLVHVIVNLIKNAREAMFKNSSDNKTLQFFLSFDNKKVKLEVKDSGIGIESENLKKMFQFGFTTKENGHGFGLKSCKTYMQEIGGDILVKSEGLNMGTSFILEFSTELVSTQN